MARREENCCAGYFACHDDQLVNPSTHKTFRTDLLSLADVDGDGIECGEVWRAVCMTQNVGQESRDHNMILMREGPSYIDVDSRRSDGEVIPFQGPAPLQVPPEFKRIGYDWVAPSATQAVPSPKEQEELQDCMRPFVRSMIAGATLQLRLDAEEAEGTAQGENIDAMASLNPDLSLLLISVSGVERSVPIRSIRSVRPPEKGNDGVMWFLPSDRDKMVVLRLAGGRFVRFRFEQKSQAAYFGTCMRLLVKSARSCPADATSRPNPPAATLR